MILCLVCIIWGCTMIFLANTWLFGSVADGALVWESIQIDSGSFINDWEKIVKAESVSSETED